MLSINTRVVCHCLTIDSHMNLVAQRKHKVIKEKRVAIDEEVEKLENICFLIEIKYPSLLDNMILVWEVSNKWRMCVNFTNLDAICSKYPYPLLNIDRLIDGSSCYKNLIFMDANSKYSQIKMELLDVPMMMFMSNQSKYSYNIVSFGL